jgi:transposase
LSFIASIWLATEPRDLRADSETALAKVVVVLVATQPHCTYLFSNRGATWMEVLLRDGVNGWLAIHGLN